MGQVLIDSCVLIDVLRGHRPAMDFLVGLVETPLVAAVTIGELFSGAHRPGEEARIIELATQLELVPADLEWPGWVANSVDSTALLTASP